MLAPIMMTSCSYKASNVPEIGLDCPGRMVADRRQRQSSVGGDRLNGAHVTIQHTHTVKRCDDIWPDKPGDVMMRTQWIKALRAG